MRFRHMRWNRNVEEPTELAFNPWLSETAGLLRVSSCTFGFVGDTSGILYQPVCVGCNALHCNFPGRELPAVILWISDILGRQDRSGRT